VYTFTKLNGTSLFDLATVVTFTSQMQMQNQSFARRTPPIVFSCPRLQTNDNSILRRRRAAPFHELPMQATHTAVVHPDPCTVRDASGARLGRSYQRRNAALVPVEKSPAVDYVLGLLWMVGNLNTRQS